MHKNRGSQNYGSPCFYHYKCNINFPLRPFKFERRHNPIPRFHCPRTVWFPDSSPLWQYSRFVPKKFPILTAPVTATVKLPLPIIDHQPHCHIIPVFKCGKHQALSVKQAGIFPWEWVLHPLRFFHKRKIIVIPCKKDSTIQKYSLTKTPNLPHFTRRNSHKRNFFLQN